MVKRLEPKLYNSNREVLECNEANLREPTSAEWRALFGIPRLGCGIKTFQTSSLLVLTISFCTESSTS